MFNFQSTARVGQLLCCQSVLHKVKTEIFKYKNVKAISISNHGVGRRNMQHEIGDVKNSKSVLLEASAAIPTGVKSHEDETSEPLDGQSSSKPISKRSLKRQARAQQYKELKKRRKAENLLQTGREEAGYCLDEFDQTSYYFDNGLRKVYPYQFVFATYAKGRWVGKTLRIILEKEFGFDKPEDVDKAFHEGKIHVNGVRVSVSYVVKDCDYISHQIHRHENPVTDEKFEILADTESVVVINKPSSIPCHPCGRYRFNSVVFILGKELGYSNLRNIYRLDRLTSGVLVMGKTADATKRLEDQVLNRQVQKEYVCRVAGEFPSETVTVDQPLLALSNKLRLQVVSPRGKSSQTTFTRLSYNGRSSVVKCVPHTGRTHQIRVHLQYLGHPIINDVFYNSDAWGPNKAKGGNYEVPNDIVCATILKRHQAIKWEGGENPLFYQKLKEMEEQKQQETIDSKNSEPAIVSDAQLQVNNSTQTVKVADENGDSADKNQNDKNTICHPDSSLLCTGSVTATSTDDSALVSHKIKDSDSGNGCATMTICANQSDIPIADSVTDSDSIASKSDKSDESRGLSHSAMDSSSERSCSIAINASTPKARQETDTNNATDIANESLFIAADTEANSTGLGFDWTKWHVDESCDLCRKTTIDPKPRDLVMFLHAWKYKGPDWEYQTTLPDWAVDDWHDEDQFMLEQTKTTTTTSSSTSGVDLTTNQQADADT